MTRAAIRWSLATVGLAMFSAAGAWAIQAPYALPPTHQRQCVATGDIPAVSTRRVTVPWKRPFATGQYAVIGSVSDSSESGRSIELSHVIAPSAPGSASAVVFNRDASAAHSGVLCLDASTDSDAVAGFPP